MSENEKLNIEFERLKLETAKLEWEKEKWKTEREDKKHEYEIILKMVEILKEVPQSPKTPFEMKCPKCEKTFYAIPYKRIVCPFCQTQLQKDP